MGFDYSIIDETMAMAGVAELNQYVSEASAFLASIGERKAAYPARDGKVIVHKCPAGKWNPDLFFIEYVYGGQVARFAPLQKRAASVVLCYLGAV